MAPTTSNTVSDSFPSPRQLQLDVFEFWCHVITQPCNNAQIYAQRVEGYKGIMQQVGDSIGDYGRLFNRMQLATLCCDLMNRPIVFEASDDEKENDNENVNQEEEQDDEEYDGLEPLCDLSPEMWREYSEMVQAIHDNLLRKDANSREGDDPDESIDETLQSKPKFTEEYDQIIDLLSLCEIVALFQERLEKLQESKAKVEKQLLNRVEKAVEEYKNGINKLDLPEDSTELLTGFLLADMYKSKPKNLAQRLYDHLYGIMTNDQYDVGYFQIVQQTRRLVSRWQNQVLDVPKLCMLGYGGFHKRKSSMMDDAVSVSSWGIDADEDEERKQLVEQQQQESDEDLTGYATPTGAGDDDDATAGEAEAHSAFAFSTQPPVPENAHESDDDDDEEEKEEEKEEDVSDGDKKPRAKRKMSETEESDEDEDFTQAEKTRTRSADLPRRSSRLAGNEPSAVLPPRKKRAPSRAAKKSVVYDEEEMPLRQDDSSSEDASPPRKRAAVARKPPLLEDESISEPESRPPPQKKTAPVARKPAPADSDSDSTDADGRPPPRRRVSAPPARRPTKKNPTVIEWSESEDDDTPAPPPKRARSIPTRRRSSGGKQKHKKRRFFTTEEKIALKDGVRRFGKGNWAVIRLNSDGVLLSRTNVNLKDCYRTMEKRGEI